MQLMIQIAMNEIISLMIDNINIDLSACYITKIFFLYVIPPHAK